MLCTLKILFSSVRIISIQTNNIILKLKQNSHYPGGRLFVVYCTCLGSISIASASFKLLSIYLCFLSHGLSAPSPVFVPSLSVAISSGHSWRVQVFSKEIRFVTLDTMAKGCIATAYSKICCDLFVIESPYICLTGKS